MTITITTNNVPRSVLYWSDLNAKEQAEFDYLDTDERKLEARFFLYKGSIHDMGEFMRTDNLEGLEGYDAYRSDTYFSGICFRFPQEDKCTDYENVIVGMFFVD